MVIALVAASWAHVPVIYTTGPDDDWCAAVNATIGNDFVLLEPGEYRGPCTFEAKVSDVDAELTTLQSLDPANRARFVGTDGDFVLRVTGRRAILLALEFSALPAGVDAVRLDSPLEAWVQKSTFDDVAGTAVRVVGTQQNVVQSTFRDVGAAVRAACPGGPCTTAVAVSENLVLDAAVGFAVDPGATLASRDDVVSAVDGVVSRGGASVDGALVLATHVGLDLGGGASFVGASVVSAPVAVRADPGADVDLVSDTLLGQVEVTGVAALVGSCAVDRALGDLGGAEIAGTVVCGDGCFVDAAALDVYPAPGSPLPGAGIPDPRSRADWCGHPRRDPPTAGAFEDVGGVGPGPLALVPRSEVDCAPTETPVDPPDPHTGELVPTDHTGVPDGAEPPIVRSDGAGDGCGCDGSGGRAALVAALVAFSTARRRMGVRADTLTGPSASRM